MLRAVTSRRSASARPGPGMSRNMPRELRHAGIDVRWAAVWIAASIMFTGALSLAIWIPAEASDQVGNAALESLTQDAFRQLDSMTTPDHAAQSTDDAHRQAAEANARTYHREVMQRSATSGAPLPSLPNLDNFTELLHNAGPRQPVDVSDLAQQGKQLLNPYAGQDEDRYATRVLVFVSSSLPDTVIQNYLRQTQRIGGAVVFRGLVNNTMQDMRDYLARQIAALNEPSGDGPAIEPSILIDPTLFRRFNIDQAPITIATQADIKPCITDRTENGCPTPPYYAVRGDVSLAWALGLIARQSDSDAIKDALRPLIKRLNGK
jgi:type-F conjugative transfer system pilin assembly protein TrbC